MPKFNFSFNFKPKSKKVIIITLIILLPVFSIIAGLLVFGVYIKNKIYPRVRIAGISVGYKTKNEALDIIQNRFRIPEKIVLSAKGQNFELSLKDIDYSYNFDGAVDKAFQTHRQKGRLFTFFLGPSSFIKAEEIKLTPSFNEMKINEYLQIISSQLATEPQAPEASLVNGKVEINKGRSGETIDKAKFLETLINKLSLQNFSVTDIPFLEINPKLTDEEAETFRLRAEKLVGKTIVLLHEYDSFLLKDERLLQFIDARENFKNDIIGNFIDSELVPKVNREPQNAVFKFANGKVLEFKPAKNGATINKTLLRAQLSQEVSKLEAGEEKNISLTIPIESTFPKITTEEVNSLGIKELLGRGTSKFKGSIPGRVFNIGLSSSKINGTLVPPGETFSFNNTVGDVSRLTGYKQAYIIKDGKTVLGDGGGLCQVSTTLFRAALNAGLPVVERRAHSYRVGYYEQDSGPGIDATVFSPSTDFKFVNDTPGHILIQTIFEAERVSLAFEIYGTSDGRVATVTKPVITSSSAPPEDLYIDDPTIPAGQIKQIEHKAWGAKVNFSYKVERNGEVLMNKTFYSNYQPWQAVFLRGTGPTI